MREREGERLKEARGRYRDIEGELPACSGVINLCEGQDTGEVSLKQVN